MKTERRQDLRTNELSQQLDQLTDYVRRNATRLTLIVTAVAIVVIAIFWYSQNRRLQIMQGWASLNSDAVLMEEGGGPFGTYEKLIQEDRDAGLTAAALLRMGEAALDKYSTAVATTDPAMPTNPADYLAKAQQAYTQLVDRYPQNLSAVGCAMFMLGVISEDQGNPAKAKEWYQKIVADQRFANTPFKHQAEYRLAAFDRWMAPVAFAAPLQTVPEPPSPPPGVKGRTISPLGSAVQPVTITPGGNGQTVPAALPVNPAAIPAGTVPPVTAPGSGSAQPPSVPAGQPQPPTPPAGESSPPNAR